MNRETIIQHIQINQSRMSAIVTYIDSVIGELREDISKMEIKNQALLQELQCTDKKPPDPMNGPEGFCLTPLYIRIKKLDDQMP
jgi:hypothetical protein